MNTRFIVSAMLCILPLSLFAQVQDTARQPRKLKEVSVTAAKPVIKQEIDRISYDLQADPDSRSNSVLEMMRKVPYLSLDANNNLLLKGNASYKILINGKPSGAMERNYKDILRTMPASAVQRIEVITIPPSKYDAEGHAGIINIIISKNQSNGYSGAINMNAKFPRGGPGIGGSFSARQGKFGIMAYGGASISNTPETALSNERITFNRTLTQTGSLTNDNRSGYLGTEWSFEIDSCNLVSAQFNINGSRTEESNEQRSLLKDENGPPQGFAFANSGDGQGNGLDLSVSYERGFKSGKNRLLTVSYRYFTYNNDQHNNITIDNAGNTGHKIPDNRQTNNSTAAEQTIQVDYIQLIQKKMSMEAGVKAIFRDNESDYQYNALNASSGQFELDAGRSGHFLNDQFILGVYNTWQYQLKKWAFKGGARVERTVMHGDFRSTNTTVRQHYFNVIPALAINRKFRNNSSLNIGFTQRIKRPGINKLNPFVDRSDPNFETTGNPHLRPSVMNNIQLGYGTAGKLAVNLGVAYAFFRNLDMRITELNTQTNITRSTFANVGKGSAFTGNVHVTYPLTKQWNATLNGNMAYIRMNGISDSALIRINRIIYNINCTTAYRFKKGWRLSVGLGATGPGLVSLQGISNALISTSCTLSRELLSDKLSLAAGVSNPFTKYRLSIVETTGPGFAESSSIREYFRSCNLSINYRFGKLKDAIKKTKRGINNDDVSNSKGGL